MKALLIFNLNNEDDRHDYELTRQASSMSIVLSEIDNYLRGITKYGFLDKRELMKDELELANAIRDKLHELAVEMKVEL